MENIHNLVFLKYIKYILLVKDILQSDILDILDKI